MKIRTCVLDYQKMFPDEYKLDLAEIKWKRDNLETRMAEIKGSYAVERELFAIGTKLLAMLELKLTKEEQKWLFRTKEGGRWFAREFKQFRVTQEV